MRKWKKVVVIIVICIAVTALFVVGFKASINSITPKTYTTAKKDCEKVLAQYQTEMEQIAVDALNGDRTARGKFQDYSYRCDQENGYVVYGIDAQGMLGGQYWELVYAADGTFGGETESYLYEEANGNNIMRAEKINENWWFLWTDYDGTARSDQ